MAKKTNQILLTILTGLNISMVFYCVACYQSAHDFFYNNSDLIHVPAIIHNLIYEKGHLTDWNYAETPFFFPDIMISYIIGLFTSNIIEIIQIYALIQILCFLFFIAFLLKLASNGSIKISMGILSTLTIFLLSSEFFNKSYLELIPAMLQSADHFGATLMVIICLYLFIQLCIQKKIYLGIIFFTITAISIFSDILVGFYFTIPLIITIIVCRLLNFLSFKNAFQLIALLLFTTATGYFLYKYFPLHYYRSNSFIHYHSGNIKNFIKVMINFFHSTPAIAIMWVGFILFAPIALVKTYIREKEKLTLDTNWSNFILLWIVITLLWATPAFIITDHNLALASSPVHYLGLRHLQPYIMMPVFIGLPLLLSQHNPIIKLWEKKSIYVSCLLLIIVSCINRPALKLQNLTTYYPPQIACFDNYARKFNLHAGISDYWNARPFSSYNHSGVQVVVVYPNISPYIHINSMTQYSAIPRYDFIIVNNLDKELIRTRFGNPTSQFTCPGNYEFYVYANNSMQNLFSSFRIL